MLQLRTHQVTAAQNLQDNERGICVMPTGAGKTIVAIYDAMSRMKSPEPRTVVVVAPRIMLLEQLCSEFMEFITNAEALQVRSGKTSHLSTTSAKRIAAWAESVPGHKIIFTTYQSMHKIMESGIEVDTMYYDEAHNSTQLRYYHVVRYFRVNARRIFFFTATPKVSKYLSRPGMNNADVYGNIIASVSAPTLVRNGYIVPPKVVATEMPDVDNFNGAAERDYHNIIESLKQHNVSKILICAKRTQDIMDLITETRFARTVAEMGYSLMHISCKFGAVIDGETVERDEFFRTLNEWGRDRDKKFIVMNHSMLAEGINIKALEAVMFMRNMDVINICQYIGRTLRLHPDDDIALRNGTLTPGNLSGYSKSCGLVIIPVHCKSTRAVVHTVQQTVNTVFGKGGIPYAQMAKPPKPKKKEQKEKAQ